MGSIFGSGKRILLLNYSYKDNHILLDYDASKFGGKQPEDWGILAEAGYLDDLWYNTFSIGDFNTSVDTDPRFTSGQGAEQLRIFQWILTPSDLVSKILPNLWNYYELDVHIMNNQFFHNDYLLEKYLSLNNRQQESLGLVMLDYVGDQKLLTELVTASNWGFKIQVEQVIANIGFAQGDSELDITMKFYECMEDPMWGQRENDFDEYFKNSQQSLRRPCIKDSFVCFGKKGLWILEDRLGMKIRDLSIWYTFGKNPEGAISDRVVFKKKWSNVEAHDWLWITAFDSLCVSRDPAPIDAGWVLPKETPVEKPESSLTETYVDSHQTCLESFLDEYANEEEFSPIRKILNWIMDKWVRTP
jgi:hypothetical protein